jgi:hypothetical protein
MARLPYVAPDGDVTARILARRGGKLTALDGMLLHSPEFADGWNSMLGAVRRYRLTSGTAPAYLSLHELASMAVFEEPAYREAVTTPWMKRIVDSAIGRERRVFGLHKSFG